MAEALWLVEKKVFNGLGTINGVEAMLINADDGQTEAATIVEAETAINLLFPTQSGEDVVYAAGYFTAAKLISDLAAASDLKTDLDNVIFGRILGRKTTA